MPPSSSFRRSATSVTSWLVGRRSCHNRQQLRQLAGLEWRTRLPVEAPRLLAYLEEFISPMSSGLVSAHSGRSDGHYRMDSANGRSSGDASANRWGFQRRELSMGIKARDTPHHQVGRDRLPLPHLLEKERGTRIAALITQIMRPIGLHIASIFAPVSPPTTIQSMPHPSHRRRSSGPSKGATEANEDAPALGARSECAVAPRSYFPRWRQAKNAAIPSSPNPAAAF